MNNAMFVSAVGGRKKDAKLFGCGVGGGGRGGGPGRSNHRIGKNSADAECAVGEEKTLLSALCLDAPHLFPYS